MEVTLKTMPLNLKPMGMCQRAVYKALQAELAQMSAATAAAIRTMPLAASIARNRSREYFELFCETVTRCLVDAMDYLLRRCLPLEPRCDTRWRPDHPTTCGERFRGTLSF
jgi:hypothetical protein